MSLIDSDEPLMPKADPLERPDWHEADVQAIRAMYADPQGRRALDWMLFAFGTHDTSFRPSSDRLTAFAEGRRHAGTTLVHMIRYADTRTDPDKIAVRTAGEQK